MNDIRDFKIIADDIMSDIKANDSLKDITLQRCINKRHAPIGKILAAAACIIVIFGFVNMSGILQLNTNTVEPDNQEMNIMAAIDGGVDTLIEQTTNSVLPGIDIEDGIKIETLAEAERLFGTNFLNPAFVPENFMLDNIFAYRNEKETTDKIILTYLSGDQAFLIIEEKGDDQNGFANYKPVDINGVGGYLKSEPSEGSNNENNPDTELHWVKSGIHYSVTGMISENNALKVAKSME